MAHNLIKYCILWTSEAELVLSFAPVYANAWALEMSSIAHVYANLLVLVDSLLPLTSICRMGRQLLALFVPKICNKTQHIYYVICVQWCGIVELMYWSIKCWQCYNDEIEPLRWAPTLHNWHKCQNLSLRLSSKLAEVYNTKTWFINCVHKHH